MTVKLIMALAFAAGTSGAALAQTDPATPAPDAGAAGSFTMPQSWEGNIGNSLFSDPMTGTAHSQTDITNNWANMTAADQQAVRDHCATLGDGAAGTTGTTGGTDTTATEGGVGGDSANASIREICNHVEGL